jgi:hypothetical protein
MTSIILVILPKCKGSFDVQPRELYITMDIEFIKGNTSEKLKVINSEDSEINVSWYLDNPSDDLIRPNRTKIPDLSWVYLEPKSQIIEGNSNLDFFIHFNIPEDENHLDKHWEVWITFKEEESNFIKFEHAVRLHIDTPKNLKEDNNNDLTSFVLVFVFLFFIVLLFIIYFYKKKIKS